MPAAPDHTLRVMPPSTRMIEPVVKLDAVAGEVHGERRDLGRIAHAAQRHERHVLALGRRPTRTAVRAERPGEDGVDPDLRGERLGEPHRHRVEAGLGAGVRQLAGAGDERAGGADVDDRPAVVVDHVRPSADGEPERTLQVDRHRLVVEVLGDRVEALVHRRHAGVVDEHVEASEALERRGQQLVAVVPVAGVERDRLGAPAGRGGDLGGDGLADVELAGRDHDVGAGLGQRSDDRPPDPARAARDEARPGRSGRAVR